MKRPISKKKRPSRREDVNQIAARTLRAVLETTEGPQKAKSKRKPSRG